MSSHHVLVAKDPGFINMTEDNKTDVGTGGSADPNFNHHGVSRYEPKNR